MKTNTIARIVTLVGIMALPACGMKVGVDDATINAIECAFDKDCSSSSSEGSTVADEPTEETGDTTGDTGQGDADSDKGNNGNDKDKGNSADKGDKGNNGKGNSSDTETETVTYQGTNETDQDSNGGIGLMEPDGYDRTSDRLFLGTYKSDSSYVNGASCFTRYNLPSIVRPYSHLDAPFIDFETSAHELAWVAELYEDDTFDFSVNFLDKFGHPSVDLDCTCEIADAYYDYYPQKIQCACTGDQGSCPLNYDMM